MEDHLPTPIKCEKSLTSLLWFIAFCECHISHKSVTKCPFHFWVGQPWGQSVGAKQAVQHLLSDFTMVAASIWCLQRLHTRQRRSLVLFNAKMSRSNWALMKRIWSKSSSTLDSFFSWHSQCPVQCFSHRLTSSHCSHWGKARDWMEGFFGSVREAKQNELFCKLFSFTNEVRKASLNLKVWQEHSTMQVRAQNNALSHAHCQWCLTALFSSFAVMSCFQHHFDQ